MDHFLSRRLTISFSDILVTWIYQPQNLIQAKVQDLPVFLGQGSHNTLYKLTFSDNTTVAASITNAPERYFSPKMKASEIATMQYLHSSPRYNIPIPKVYDWDFTFKNPVGAPYVLREVVPGRNLNGIFHTLPLEQQLAVIKELAAVQAELSKPSEFGKIGSIYSRKGKDGNQEFYVGELLSCRSTGESESSAKGPFNTLEELWQARIEKETIYAIKEWSDLPTDEIPTRHSPPIPTPNPTKFTPQLFGEMLQCLSALSTKFVPPKELAVTCIQHADLAIRNVLFDDNEFKITGVIDWEFAQVVPRVITGRFPNDIGCDGNEVLQDRLYERGEVNTGKFEFWNHHYYDWTSLRSPLPEPKELHDPPSTQEHRPLPLPSPRSDPTFLIKLFYLRKFYASTIGIKNFCLSTLFIDSVAYVKFHEIVMGGWECWFKHREWIREVYWRLREKEGRKMEEEDDDGAGGKHEALIKVPEVFERKVRPNYLDLGEFDSEKE